MTKSHDGTQNTTATEENVEEEVDGQEGSAEATTQIMKMRKQVHDIAQNEEALHTLASYTFKGLEKENIPPALMEGVLRGFKIDDFFKKNVYAIPFQNNNTGKQEYSLVVSIDQQRKVAVQSGQTGKSEPRFTDDEEGNPVSCSVTVWRKGGSEEGFTATVYFDEYKQTYYDKRTGTRKVAGLWATKPRTMLAKVAESHALRMAFPEQLKDYYIEEEYEGDRVQAESVIVHDSWNQDEIDAIEDEEELDAYYKKNKGLGRGFDEAIIKRRNELKNQDS